MRRLEVMVYETRCEETSVSSDSATTTLEIVLTSQHIRDVSECYSTANCISFVWNQHCRKDLPFLTDANAVAETVVGGASIARPSDCRNTDS